ncbi:hypothetical protein VPH35_063085 [Triticum aestivum]
MESLADEILEEILLKLPTRDAARCCCVSRLWQKIVTDPSFRALHAKETHVVSGDGTEALLVSEICVPGKPLEATVSNASSGKPMCSVDDLAVGYSPINVCNGFLLIAPRVKNSPLFVCNPVTGEKLEIAPPREINLVYRRMDTMGFSPSTNQYKLFHFSFTVDPRWRRHPHLIPCSTRYGLYSSPPVLLNGKLFGVVRRSGCYGPPDRMLVIDVASEALGTYRLRDPRITEEAAVVHTLELRGQLCIAVHVRHQLDFWIMPPLGAQLHNMEDEKLPKWRLCYSFYIDIYGTKDHMSGAWFNDAGGLLCYKLRDRLYKYDTTKNKKQQQQTCVWDNQIWMPATQSSNNNRRWSVYGGYRPSLLSPRLAFESNLQHKDAQEHFEHALLHTVGCHLINVTKIK